MDDKTREGIMDHITVDNKAMRGSYRAMYWSQLFNSNTSWRVKLLAVRSLWITRNWWK